MKLEFQTGGSVLSKIIVAIVLALPAVALADPCSTFLDIVGNKFQSYSTIQSSCADNDGTSAYVNLHHGARI